MSLMNELKKLKPQLPESECFVPEWNRAVTLRGFTVLEGRKLRQGVGKGSDEDNEALALKTIAYSIGRLETKKTDSREMRQVIEEINARSDRPFADDEGIEAIENLSELTVRKLMNAFASISNPEDKEGNAGAPNGASSTGLPSPSAAQSLN